MGVEFLTSPRPEPPIAVAAMSNDVVICTVVPEDSSGNILPPNIQEQSRQVFRLLGKVLQEAGSSLGKVMHVTVYLVNIKDRAAMTDEWTAAFSPPYPARATIGVKELGHPDMLIEITAIAQR